MHRFSAGDDNDDSFDDILANIEEPKIAPSSTQIPSQPKKSRISVDFDDGDDILANISMPTTTDAPSNAATTSIPSVAITISKSNCILVNPKQRGNPILKSITNIPWEFDEAIIPDYIVGTTNCVLYLSLRYHQLNPDYIHTRLKLLGKRFELRVLLVQVDTKVGN